MIQELMEAVMDKWGSDSTLASFPLHFADAGKRNAPYAVYYLNQSAPTYMFQGQLDACRLQFNVYSRDESLAEILLIEEAIRALFERHELDLGSWGQTTVLHLEDRAQLKTPTGAWQTTLIFSFGAPRA